MNIAVAIPGYDAVQPETAFALMNLASLLTARSVKYTRLAVRRDANLSHMRNVVLNTFLQTGHDAILMIDDDVAFRAEDAIRLVEQVETSHFVGGRYPKKRIGAGWSCYPKPDGRREGSLVEGRLVSAGFLAVSRIAVQMMAGVSEVFDDHQYGEMRAISQSGVHEGRWVGDDESICLRWQGLGGITWIDESIQADHVGSFTYTAEHV